MNMEENTNGNILQQARATAPVAGQQPTQPVAQQAQPQPVQQPVQQPQQQFTQLQQGFNAPPPQNGFAQQPAQQPAPAPVQTDRTSEQFSKLADSNSRMSQQLGTLQQQNEELRREIQRQQQRPVQQPQTQQYGQQQAQPQQQSALPKLEDYIEIDPRTGERFVNEAKFNSAMADILQKANRAEQLAQNVAQQSEKREIDRQFREAYNTYPQLDPQGGQYDGRFLSQSRAIVYDSLINPQDYGGRSLGLKEAADFIAQAGTAGTQQRAATNQQVQTPTVNEANQAQKEQASAQAQSTPGAVAQNIDAEQEHLRQVRGTRFGDDEAIAVRLLNSTHRLADVEAGQGPQPVRY